jgi:hypothetical protein
MIAEGEFISDDPIVRINTTGQRHRTDELVGHDIMDTHTYDDSGMGHVDAHWNGARGMSAGGSVA